MFTPTVDISANLNSLSAQFDVAEHQYVCLSAIAYRYESEMETGSGVSIKIIESQLALLKEYIGHSIDKRQVSWLKEKMDDSKRDIQTSYFDIFRGSISHEKGLPEEGEVKASTSKTEDPLCNEFSKKISDQINRAFDALNISETTDLLELQAKLEQRLRDNTEVFHYLLQDCLEVHVVKKDLVPVLKSLNEKKKRLRASLTAAVKDIFSASQVGDIDWLKMQFEKTDPQKRKAFFCQKKMDSSSQFTPLHTAAYFDHGQFLEKLIKHGGQRSVNLKDKYGYAPLHFAAKMGAVGSTTILLDHKANIDLRGEYGRTPLIMAAFNGQATVAQLLVRRGANVNAQNDMKEASGDGLTPLHQAVFNGHLEIVKVLALDPRLDVLKCDVKGFSAVYYAFQSGLSSILDILLNHPNWSDPTSLKNPNRLECLLRIPSKENIAEVVKIVKRKQTEVVLQKRGEELRKIKNEVLKQTLHQFRLNRSKELRSNGTSRSQRSAMVDAEVKEKEQALTDQMEKDIQTELQDFLHHEGKKREGDFEEIPI